MQDSQSVILKFLSALFSGAMLLLTATVVVGSYVFSFSSHARPLIEPLSSVLAPLSENTAVQSFVDFNAATSAALSATFLSAAAEGTAAVAESFSEDKPSLFSYLAVQAKTFSARLFQLVISSTQTALVQIAAKVTKPPQPASVAVAVAPTPQQQPASVVVAAAPTAQDSGTMVSSPAPASAPIAVNTPAPTSAVAPQPTVSATSPITMSGVSQNYVDDQLQILRNSLSSEIFKYSSAQFPNAPGISQSTANLAVSQRIDQLSGTRLSNITVSGVSGLTAADIPTDLTASNYLALTGGTLSGDLTLSGSLTVAGTQTFSGALTLPYFTATSSTASTLPYASSTAITVSGTASTSDLIVSNSFSLGTLTGFLKATAGAVTTSLIDLASDVTGILPVGNGGTGWGSLTANSLLLGNGTGAVATTSAGVNGQVLSLIGGVPTWTTRAINTTYPLQGGGDLSEDRTLTLAFGTTTQNFWNAYNNFSSLFATNASSTNATTTNLHITGLAGAGLGVDENGRVYAAATTTAGTGLSYAGGAFNVNTSQNIATLSNLTSNGFVKTSGGDGTLSIDTTTYLTGNEAITLSGDVSGSGTTAITTTIGAGKVTNTMLAGSIAYAKLALTGAILNADLSGSIAASKLVGTDIATVGTITSGTWSGLFGAVSGANLTNLTAANITGSNTLPDSVLSTNVPLLNAANAFTNAGNNTFVGNVGIGNSTIDSTFAPRLEVYSTLTDGTGGVLINNFYPTLTFFDRSSGAQGAYRFGLNNVGGFSLEIDAAEDGTFETKAFTVDEAGLVGIGTTTPDRPLHVNGGSVMSALGTGGTFKVSSNTISGGVLEMGIHTGTGALAIQGNTQATNVARNLLLQPFGGNVGIGTTSPAELLSISGDSNGSGGTANPVRMIIDDSDNGSAWDLVNPFTSLAFSRSVDGSGEGTGIAAEIGAVMGAATGGNVRMGFFTAPTTAGTMLERMSILDSGNVGIGTTTPGALLDLYGSTPIPKVTNSNTSGYGAWTFFENATVQGSLQSIGSAFATTDRRNDLELVAHNGDISLWPSATQTVTFKSGGNVGIGTTSPWRTLSVTGTVGFDGLTGSTGAGSLCLSANKEVVYNSGSDSCLSSTRATKHDIVEIGVSGSTIIGALQPVSFVYNNDASSTVRYGFIAEDTAAVDAHLATYDASGAISGIDDRSIISILVKALKELFAQLNALASVVSGFADTFTTNRLCVGSTCITETELKALLEERSINASDTDGSSTDSSGSDDTATSTPDTIGPVITLSGANPAHIDIGATYIDLGATVTDNVDQNLGYRVSLGGATSTDPSALVLDTSTSTTHIITYSATDQAGNEGLTTRTVIVGE